MSKNYISFIVVIASIALLFVLVKLGGAKPSNNGGEVKGSSSSNYALAYNPQDNFAGNPNATVVLIEYSDFQCPACAYFHAVINQLRTTYPDSVVFIYRHFPLPQHNNAKMAAYASEAAAKQGRFWEMHNLIFENQQDWSEKNPADSIFEGYAKQLGLDMERYKIDVKDPQIAQKVAQQLASGEKLNVTGTPTFYLNGKQIRGTDLDSFKKLIDEQLKS